MYFGIVAGTCVATQKVPELKGMCLKVLFPSDQKGQNRGEPVIVIDAVGARPGDLVMWVAKREASLAIPGAQLVNMYPVDAAITGIIDAIG